MMDRDATNNVALNLLNSEEDTKITVISCFSRGIADVGKKFKMGEGELVLKRITKIVQFRLCKAHFLFQITFGEEAKKGAVSDGTYCGNVAGR
jgi:hypothetical protein